MKRCVPHVSRDGPQEGARGWSLSVSKPAGQRRCGLIQPAPETGLNQTVRLELLQGIRELMGARLGSDDPVREDELDLVALVRAVIAMGADPVVLERHMGSRGEHARDRRGGSIQRTKR